MKRILIVGILILFAGMLQAQNVGIGVPVPLQKLDVNGAVRLGNTGTSIAGTLRYSSGRFEGYDGNAWNWLNGFKLPLDTSIIATGISVLKITNLAASDNSHAIEGRSTGLNSNAIYAIAENTLGNGIGVSANSNALNGTGVLGIASSATGDNYGVKGRNNGISGVGVDGIALNISGTSIGVRGIAYSFTGIGVYTINLSGGKALKTQGGVMLTGIGEGLGNVLTSDVDGNATWQSLAGSHNHFGETWSGSADNGFTIVNTNSVFGKYGINCVSSNGIGILGTSNGSVGTGVIGLVAHGAVPFLEGNSGLVGINGDGNGLYATSMTGYAIKAHKQNLASANGSVALFVNDKTTNTSPILVLQNAATNPTALELNNGYIKVSGTNKMAFVHTTNAGNIINNISTLNYPNATATDMLFVTHNYSPVNTYFNYNYGVYWNGAAWTIYIEAFATPMPVNINFNVMVIKQ